MTAGSTISLYGHQLANPQFRTCMSDGCLLTSSLDGKSVDLIDEQKNLSLIITELNEEAIQIDVSLLGFTAARERLHSLASGR